MEGRISELVEDLTAVSQTLDDTARQKLYNSLQHLSWALETPYDAIQRLAYGVSLEEDQVIVVKPAG